MGVGRGGAEGPCPPLDVENVSKKRLFFQFRGVKNKFHRFWRSLEKFLEKCPIASPWKKSFRRPWPDTLQFKWKNNHNRAIPLAAKYTLIFCFSNRRCTCDVIFMDWVTKWQGVSFGSGYRSADNSGGSRGGSLGQLSPQTSVAPPWMAPLCHKCAPFWCPWK